ncbi:Osmolarity sensory histidine kinase EnvZ [hydrothermal vent metagenome]|uniref:histidine kinase n=1 Tax=hydrothermal vent metagenome TaxID=652676 RepID=A0A3B1ACQ0_9ZZZZ
MSLIPNTLFSRTMFVMISMIILSFIAGFFIFVIYFTRPMASSSADLFSLHINSVYQALHQLNPQQRETYLTKLESEGILYVIRDENARPGRTAERFYERVFLEYYPQKLFAKNVEIRFEFDNVFNSEKNRLVWVKVDFGDKKIWLGTPMSKFKQPFPNNLIAQLLVALVLTLVGAYLISRVIKRPLKQLIVAADELGKGNMPEPISEEGTKEFQSMSRAFNKMSKDLKALDDDRNLMLAGISHDLRTPLARVRLALDMVDNKIEKKLYDGMVQDIEDIDKIIGQFLTFVRDGVDEEFSYEDVNDIVEHVATGFQLEGKKIKLILNGIENTMIKPIAMQRLFMNLINNAWHYGRQDVEVETSMQADHICIEIKDCGDGIPASEIERLKQPFTRMDKSRSNIKGAGLGLTIVDRIVKWHNGRLEMRSRDGGGMIVSVYLPVNLND